MIEELEIVAGNGQPLLIIGYMVPIVELEDIYFKLCDSIDNGFDASELDERAGQTLTKIDPTIPMSEVIPNYESKPRKSNKPLSKPAYIFYRDDVEMQKLGIPISDTPQCTPRTFFPFEYGHLEVFVMDNANLKAMLQDIFNVAEKRLFALLKEHGPSFMSPADQIATLLYQSAFDKDSAKKAIAYRGITTKPIPGQHYMDWVESAAKDWKLGKSKKYWNKQIKELEKSLNP